MKVESIRLAAGLEKQCKRKRVKKDFKIWGMEVLQMTQPSIVGGMSMGWIGFGGGRRGAQLGALSLMCLIHIHVEKLSKQSAQGSNWSWKCKLQSGQSIDCTGFKCVPKIMTTGNLTM